MESKAVYFLASLNMAKKEASQEDSGVFPGRIRGLGSMAPFLGTALHAPGWTVRG